MIPSFVHTKDARRGEMTEEYTCSVCHETYLKTWTDEDAMKECDENFPEMVGKPVAVVCDDCYQEFMEGK